MKVKTRIKRPPTRLALSLCMALVFVSAVLSSCNLTRTISTQSQYFTKGDTTCTIVTKTIETYDASKKGL